MKNLTIFITLILLTSASISAKAALEAEDKLTLETSFIKGNKELPNVLYIVPWQTLEKTTTQPDVLVLHSLFGDIFEPITTPKLNNQPSQLIE